MDLLRFAFNKDILSGVILFKMTPSITFYIHTYIYIHTRTRARAHIHTHTHTHTYIYIYIYIYISTFLNAY